MAAMKIPRRRMIVLAVSVPVVVFVLVSAWEVVSLDKWMFEDMGATPPEGVSVLAFDRSGVLNMAYQTHDGQLRHAVKNGRSWTTDYVADLPWPTDVSVLSMKFDSQNKILISSSMSYNESMICAVGGPGQWSVTEFGVPELGSGCLALDSEDKPHILCVAYDEQQDPFGGVDYQPVLSEYTWNGLNWTNTTIRSFPVNSFASIRCAETDELGTIKALVVRDDDGGLQGYSATILTCMSNTDGIWSSTDILSTDYEKGTGAIGGVSMTLDESGYVHAACSLFQGENFSVVYVRNAGGVWANTTAAEGGSLFPTTTSIALDREGHAFIAYYYFSEEPGEHDTYANSFQLASNEDGSWETQTVATDSLSSWYSRDSLVVDDNGGIHIAYVNNENPWYHLTYVTDTAGSEILERALWKAVTYAIYATIVVIAALVLVLSVVWINRRRVLRRKEMEDTGLFEK